MVRLIDASGTQAHLDLGGNGFSQRFAVTPAPSADAGFRYGHFARALSSRLEKQPTDLRRNSRDLGDGTLVRRTLESAQTVLTTEGWCDSEELPVVLSPAFCRR
jgi:hypothetical protein